jgi:hypothetical protein
LHFNYLAQTASSGLTAVSVEARFDPTEGMMMKKKIKVAKRNSTKTSEPVIKDIFENGKVRVVEATWKPGAESTGLELPARVTRGLKGGTLTRIYADGKKEKVKFKSGEVKYGDPAPMAVIKNASKSTVVLYSVFLK